MTELASGLIMGGSSLLGDGLNAYMSWKGMKEQRKENRRVEKLNIKFRKEDLTREERYRREDRKERDRARDDELRREKYDRSIAMVNRLNAMLNRQPLLAQNLIAMNRGRT